MPERAPHQMKTAGSDGDPPVDDLVLLRRVADGDSRALRHLYESHAGWVAARLRQKLPAHAVEDVLQETFLAVWRGAARYRGSGDVGGWVWGIARLRMARWYRDHGREPSGVVEEWVPSGEDPAGDAIERMDLERAFATLGHRDHDDRRLAEAYYREDRPVREVAARLGIPAGTVKSRLFRIRRRLIAALEREPGQ